MIKITNCLGEIEEFEDLTGKHFGEVTVIGLREISRHEPVWNCICDCGRNCFFGSRALLREDGFRGRRCHFHKMHGTAEQTAVRRAMYSTWSAMKDRCTNEKNRGYKYYGARGIYVCDEWINNFDAFFVYVQTLDHYGEPKRSIDRIDNDDGYRPGNVRWATSKEQANNTRRSKNARRKESKPRGDKAKTGL